MEKAEKSLYRKRQCHQPEVSSQGLPGYTAVPVLNTAMCVTTSQAGRSSVSTEKSGISITNHFVKVNHSVSIL